MKRTFLLTYTTVSGKHIRNLKHLKMVPITIHVYHEL